jgi:hypothetical protein
VTFNKLVRNPLSIMGVFTLFVILVSATCVYAADFTISSGETVTTTQILNGGDTGTIEEGGAIATIPQSVDGVQINGDNNVLNNSGYISTRGRGSIGLMVFNGIGNTINNSGHILTKETGSWGIFVQDGTGNTINNSGYISTSNHLGIFVIGTGNVVNNSGYISTKGFSGTGISVAGNGNTVNNSGYISTRGPRSNGIYAIQNIIINNYGGIFATGLADTAIFDEFGQDNTLNIFPGSQIVGIIDFDNAGDVINIFGHDKGVGSIIAPRFSGGLCQH